MQTKSKSVLEKQEEEEGKKTTATHLSSVVSKWFSAISPIWALCMFSAFFFSIFISILSRVCVFISVRRAFETNEKKEKKTWIYNSNTHRFQWKQLIYLPLASFICCRIETQMSAPCLAIACALRFDHSAILEWKTKRNNKNIIIKVYRIDKNCSPLFFPCSFFRLVLAPQWKMPPSRINILNSMPTRCGKMINFCLSDRGSYRTDRHTNAPLFVDFHHIDLSRNGKKQGKIWKKNPNANIESTYFPSSSSSSLSQSQKCIAPVQHNK